ncbi:hypothetical protein [Stenomitos frigidus]|nr:hypothetical protein [Stenomitos frigidus]
MNRTNVPKHFAEVSLALLEQESFCEALQFILPSPATLRSL